jgi:hypothetical protein
MKEIRIRVPKSHTAQVLRMARELGLHEPCMYDARLPESEVEVDVLSAEISTPDAKRFVDRLLDSKVLESPHATLTTRELRSIVGQDSVRELTAPLVRPVSDVLFELWQHSHVTAGFIGRLFVGSVLVGVGMCAHNFLLLAAGLLFVPLIHIVLAIAFSLDRRNGKLLWQALKALFCAMLVLASGGAVVGLTVGERMPFVSVGGPLVTAALALAIGVAGALAAGDDAGRRELIGLATASQLALVPVWTGAELARAHFSELGTRATTFAVALLTMVATSALTFVALRLSGGRLSDSALRAQRSSLV